MRRDAPVVGGSLGIHYAPYSSPFSTPIDEHTGNVCYAAWDWLGGVTCASNLETEPRDLPDDQIYMQYTGTAGQRIVESPEIDGNRTLILANCGDTLSCQNYEASDEEIIKLNCDSCPDFQRRSRWPSSGKTMPRREGQIHKMRGLANQQPLPRC